MVKSAAHPTPSDAAFGERLRQCRTDAGMTMKTVADRAGLSVGFISQVERGLTVPSLTSLRAIAQVLGRPMSHFLDPPAHGAGERAFRVAEGGIRYERLSTRFAGSQLHSVLVHEPPGHRTEPTAHPGEEIYYVLSGVLTVEIEGKATHLTAGDSLHFRSDRVHSVWNHGTAVATVLWCGTMDLFGDDAGPQDSG